MPFSLKYHIIQTSSFKFKPRGDLAMIVPCQRIELIDRSNNELLIKIYDFKKLKLSQIEEINQAFKDQMVNLPLAFVKVFINVTPLDNFFCNYVFFIKFNDATVIYGSVLVFGKDVTLSIKSVLINFSKKIGDNIDQIISNKDIEDSDSAEEIKDPITEPINIDNLIEEIKKDRRQKENEQ